MHTMPVATKFTVFRGLGPVQRRYGGYMERVLYGDLPTPRPHNAGVQLRRVVLCNHDAFLQSQGVEVPRVISGHGHVPGYLERVAAALESLSYAVLTVWQHGSQLWSGAAAAQVPPVNHRASPIVLAHSHGQRHCNMVIRHCSHTQS